MSHSKALIWSRPPLFPAALTYTVSTKVESHGFHSFHPSPLSELTALHDPYSTDRGMPYFWARPLSSAVTSAQVGLEEWSGEVTRDP